MIYKVELPELTLNRLTDVVYLQMRLLRYAASTSSINEKDCDRYLKAYQRFKGRHEQIARWLWQGHKRRKLLEEFSQGSMAEKLQWSRCLFREAITLLNNPSGYLTPYMENDHTPNWQKAGAEFLTKFYNEYFPKGLPEYFFSELSSVTFSTNEFKFQFDSLNKDLFVCPACEISVNRSQIDHYLPISIYPHLSCHPFNLVPICSDCNSVVVKGNKDLLQKDCNTRFKLENVFLIYQGYGLEELSYLKINLKTGYRTINLIEIKPMREKNTSEHIESYRNLFNMPDRWLKINRTIENQLFNKIKTSIESVNRHKSSLNIFDVYNEFNEILQKLCDERGKEPYAFMMSCWLATLINQEIKPAISSPQQIDIKKFPLLEEIASWIKQDNIEHPAYLDDSRLDKAWSLRKLVAEED